MKRILTLAILSWLIISPAFPQSLQPGDSIKTYVDFLKTKSLLSPKEYVLQSFREKDIIILSERLHPEFRQYEMIADILKDERFTGDVYTEVGVFNAGQQINDLLHKEGLSPEEVDHEILGIFKNLDMFPLWPDYNYFFLIKSVYEINQHRNKQDKISIYPLDIIFSWDSIQCDAQYKMFMDMMEPQGFPPVINRNAWMGEAFSRTYDNIKYHHPEKTKALVIMNTYHGYTRIPTYFPHPEDPMVYSTAEYIYKTYPGKVKGISINGIGNTGQLVCKGRWDAAFRVTGNVPVGFDLPGTPFGETTFDMYNFGGNAYATVNFDYIFDGLVFFEPIENFDLVWGIPGIFNDTIFVNEFYRRCAIADGITPEEARASAEIRGYVKEWNGISRTKVEGLEQYNEQINSWIKKQ